MNLNCLKYGLEYCDTIKKLYERGYDFGSKKEVARKTAALCDVLQKRIDSKSSPEDEIYQFCYNKAYCYVKNIAFKHQRIEWYFKIFGIEMIDNPYEMLYDDKYEEDLIVGDMSFIDNKTDLPREEQVEFDAKLTYNQIVNSWKYTNKGVYYKYGEVKFINRRHKHYTIYHYCGIPCSNKEVIK